MNAGTFAEEGLWAIAQLPICMEALDASLRADARGGQCVRPRGLYALQTSISSDPIMKNVFAEAHNFKAGLHAGPARAPSE